MTGSGDRWVFGYGSLMWRPGFPFQEKTSARLYGKKRAFCIYSIYHRGAPGRPGLVLGLTSGGLVDGVAFKVAEEDWPETYAYLLEREQPSETYVEASAEVELNGGDKVEALVFFSDVLHPQWAGMLDMDEQARLIAGAAGMSGRNIDYLRDLVAHLRVEGVPDPAMERLLQKAEALDPSARVRSAA